MKNANEVVTLNIAEKGLNTYIYDWYIEEDVKKYDTLGGEDIYILKDGSYGIFKPNCVWRSFQVKRKDVDKFLDLYHEYLVACWTPNQDWDVREENEKRIIELEKKMKSLEVKSA